MGLYFGCKIRKIFAFRDNLNLGLYTKEELKELVQSYAMSLVLSNCVSDLSVEDELRELNRRAAEMENNPFVCIPHDKVYDMVMARIMEIK